MLAARQPGGPGEPICGGPSSSRLAFRVPREQTPHAQERPPLPRPTAPPAGLLQCPGLLPLPPASGPRPARGPGHPRLPPVPQGALSAGRRAGAPGGGRVPQQPPRSASQQRQLQLCKRGRSPGRGVGVDTELPFLRSKATNKETCLTEATRRLLPPPPTRGQHGHQAPSSRHVPGIAQHCPPLAWTLAGLSPRWLLSLPSCLGSGLLARVPLPCPSRVPCQQAQSPQQGRGPDMQSSLGPEESQ